MKKFWSIFFKIYCILLLIFECILLTDGIKMLNVNAELGIFVITFSALLGGLILYLTIKIYKI